MKKLILSIFFIIFVVFTLESNNQVDATVKDYNSFSYINVDSGKLLKDYDSETLESELSRVRKRKWYGWNIYKINSNVRATFVTEALFSYKNEGTSAITYTLNIKQQTTTKTSVSATNSIKVQANGSTKEFKGSLNEELKLEGEYTTTTLVEEHSNLELTVDPGTVCVGYVEGSGYYTNGVACYYICFIENQIGAFEFFTISESYLRIEKLSL